jgi:hypothetical protein
MTDIIDRAEDFLFHTPYAPLPRHMSEQLIKELKAARAQSIFEQQGIPGDIWECPTCSAEWVAERDGAESFWRPRGDLI